MSKTVEDLQKPRYKVISDWPGRKDFVVGEVITLDKDFSPQYKKYEITDCQGIRTYITSFFEMFPLQFKKLEWWEERLPEEMPEYVKYAENGMVAKVDHFDLESSSAWFMFLEGGIHPYCPGGSALENTHWLPATIEEYNQYIASKK